MAWTGQITSDGSAMAASWVQGSTLTITKAYAGPNTTGTPGTQNLAIVSTESVTNGIKLGLQFTSQGISTAYTAKSVGIWAKLNGGAEKMVAFFSDAAASGGINIPTAAAMPDYAFIFYATLLISGSGNLTVNIDSSALVSLTAFNTHVQNTDAHNIKQGGHLDVETTLTNTNNLLPTSHAVYEALTNFSVWEAGATAPTNTKKLWIDPAAVTGGLKYYNGSAWVHVPVAYKT